MTTDTADDREKFVSKLTPSLHRQLKVRAAELGTGIQDAVAAGIGLWRAADPGTLPTADTSGAAPFSNWLPPGLYPAFRAECEQRGVSYIQGLAQAVTLWLAANSTANAVSDGGAAGTVPAAVGMPERKAAANQKGGVGKTAILAGIGQAYAEAGKRVLMVDYDPQGHLTDQLGLQEIADGKDSLARHMSGEAERDIRELIVALPHEQFGGRLHVLPACSDAFLLDVRLSQVRGRERALERALAPIEADYDIILIDCPPSLGLSVDAAIYYTRRRDDEAAGRSGVLIPVQAEDSSARAFDMLMSQIDDLCNDVGITVDYLGLVVNLYDPRRGYVATSSLKRWRALGEPRVVAVIHDLKEQREAVRKHQPLLVWAPGSSQAEDMRELIKEI